MAQRPLRDTMMTPAIFGQGKYGPSEPASKTPIKNNVPIIYIMSFPPRGPGGHVPGKLHANQGTPTRTFLLVVG